MADDELGLDSGTKDLIVLHDGTTLTTHGPARCLGPHCCIHNPSDHPLKDAPLQWMGGKLNMMFRVCEHEHLHPDPDSLDFHTALALARMGGYYDGWHPCCDHHCCTKE